MATKRYSMPQWLIDAKPTKITNTGAKPMSDNQAPVSYSARREPTVTSKLPTPKAGTINRASGAETYLPNQPRFKFDKLPTFDSAVKAISNSAPNKIMQRAADTFIANLDKAAGVDPASHKSFKPDTNAVESVIGDIGGTVASIGGRLPGTGVSMQSAFTPVGNAASRLATKGLTKVSPSLAPTASKVVNYALPTLAREGAEGAAYGAAISGASGDNMEDSFKSIGRNALENAVGGFALKGAGDIFSHSLGKLGKVKVKSDDEINVSYTKENGSEGMMKKVLFDKESTPLTVNEGVSTLNQSKVADMPTFKGDFDNKVTNELPTVSKVETQVEQPKANLPMINDEVMFTDNLKRANAGTVSKHNNDGTVEITTPEGSKFTAIKNGEDFEAVQSKPTTPEQIPIEDRIGVDRNVLKDKTVIPYQQLHPELKSHIQNEADVVLGELKRTVKGSRTTSKLYTGHMETKTTGLKRMTSSEIASLLNDGHGYKDIETALNNIIKDHGRENTPLSKKVEALIDMRLTKGYSEFDSTIDVSPNHEYVSMKNSIEGNTPKTNENQFLEPLGDSQASTLPTINKAVSEPVSSEKVVPMLKSDKTVDAMGAATRIHSTQQIKSTKIKEKTPIGEKLSYLYRHNVDILNDLKKVDEETYKLAQNSKKVGGTPVAIFNDNLVDRVGNPIGESLKAIKKDFPTDKEQYNDVMNYILHKHNIDRAREGKHVYRDFESDESAKVVALLEKQHPEWKALNDRLVKFINTFEEEWGHKSGLISDDAWDELKVMYKNYVPTQREFSDIELGVRKGSGSSGFVGQGSTLKKATGSSRDIKDPFENVMTLVNRTVRAARYNEVGQKLVDVIKKNPDEMSRYAEIIPETEMVRNPKFIKPLPTIPGYPTPKAVVNTVPEFIEKPVQINANDKSIRTVMIDGKQVNIKFNDKGLLESMEGVYKNVELNDFEKGMNAITTKFKSLITTDNPFFAVRNVARDIPTAYINGSERNPFKFFKDYGSAMKDIKTNSPITQRYRAMGGEMSNFFNPEESSKAVENLTKDKNLFQKSIGKIQGFNNAMESAPRLAEFKRTLDKTGDIQQALYDSAEVTTNFSRGGDWIKKADKTLVPYLNASVQGIDKTIRQVKNKPLATALKGATIVTLPTLFLDFVNKDNENYKQLDNRTKDNNFLIPMGDAFIKLPKSREMGVLFGSLIERSIRAANGEDGSFKGFGNTVATNFSPTNPVESNILSPILNLKGNKDFANRPIESMSLQDEAIEDRYDEKSTEPAKVLSNAIGKYAGLSPKEIDYLFKSYTGVIGQFVQPMTTKATYNGKPGNLMMPVKSSFVADPLYSNQAINDFYLNKDMLTQLANKYTKEKGIDPDEVTTADSYKNRFIKVSKEMTDLSKAARESTDEAEIKRYRQQMAKIAKEANDLLTTTNRNKLMKQFNESSLPMLNNKSATKSDTRSTSGDRKLTGDRKLESKR